MTTPSLNQRVVLQRTERLFRNICNTIEHPMSSGSSSREDPAAKLQDSSHLKCLACVHGKLSPESAGLSKLKVISASAASLLDVRAHHWTPWCNLPSTEKCAVWERATNSFSWISGVLCQIRFGRIVVWNSGSATIVSWVCRFIRTPYNPLIATGSRLQNFRSAFERQGVRNFILGRFRNSVKSLIDVSSSEESHFPAKNISRNLKVYSKSLQNWTKLAESQILAECGTGMNESLDTFNDKLKCKHGNLTIEDKKSVPEEAWFILKKYFPSCISYPSTVTECEECQWV